MAVKNDDKYSAHFDFIVKRYLIWLIAFFSLLFLLFLLIHFYIIFLYLIFLLIPSYSLLYHFLLKLNSLIIDWFSRFYLFIFYDCFFSFIEDIFSSLYFMRLFTNDFSSFWPDFWQSLFASFKLLLDRLTDLFQFFSSYFRAPPSNRMLLILDDDRREYERSLPEMEFLFSSLCIFML